MEETNHVAVRGHKGGGYGGVDDSAVRRWRAADFMGNGTGVPCHDVVSFHRHAWLTVFRVWWWIEPDDYNSRRGRREYLARR